MNFRMHYTLGAALVALALGVTAPSANAQENYKGTFNLPFETHWGGAVLQPGEYTVSIEGGVYGPKIIRVRGNGQVATALAPAYEVKPVTDSGHLKLVKVGGVYTLYRLDAGLIGQSYTFSLPKNARDIEAATVLSSQ